MHNRVWGRYYRLRSAILHVTAYGRGFRLRVTSPHREVSFGGLVETVFDTILHEKTGEGDL